MTSPPLRAASSPEKRAPTLRPGWHLQRVPLTTSTQPGHGTLPWRCVHSWAGGSATDMAGKARSGPAVPRLQLCRPQAQRSADAWQARATHLVAGGWALGSGPPARETWPPPPCWGCSPGRSRGRVMREDRQPGAPAGPAHTISHGAVAAGQSSAPACCLGCGGVGPGPGPGQWTGLPGMGELLEASEASLESGPGMRVWCGCQVRPHPSPLSCGQQSRQGGETQMGLAWREEDRRKGGSQRHGEDSRWEDRRQGGRQRCREDGEVGGTVHLQSDGWEAASPGQRPCRRFRFLLRPSALLPPGAGRALC